jgi:hypothetical protein
MQKLWPNCGQIVDKLWTNCGQIVDKLWTNCGQIVANLRFVTVCGFCGKSSYFVIKYYYRAEFTTMLSRTVVHIRGIKDDSPQSILMTSYCYLMLTTTFK